MLPIAADTSVLQLKSSLPSGIPPGNTLGVMNLPPSLHPIDPNAVLRALFVGATVNGLRFGLLQLIFDTANTQGEAYLNLASSWLTYDTRPNEFPEIDQLIESDQELEVQRAVALRHKQVADVEVQSTWPHFVMTFTDGTVLYVNGKDSQHEPWTAGLSHVPAEQQVQVIASPGGELAFILPRINKSEP